MEAPMNASKLQAPSFRVTPALLLLVAAACSDGAITQSRPPAIQPVAGGGTRGELLDKQLALVALDSRTDAPIAGAQIWLGEGTNATVVGSTDAQGELRVEGKALEDALASDASVAVTAVKAGFVTTSYVGVDRESATLALRSQVAEAELVEVRVHLQEFEPQAAPGAGKYRLGTAAVSRAPDFLDDDFASVRAEPPPPTCRWINLTTSCVLTLEASPGKHTIFALVALGTDAGTPSDPSDDSLEVTGINALTVELPLERPDELVGLPKVKTQLTSLVVAPSAPPPGMDKVIGVPGINRSGDVMVFPNFPSEVSTWAVPVAQQEFAGEVLWGVATAASSDGSQRARVVRRGIQAPVDPASEPIDVSTSAFLDPTSVSVNDSELTVAAPPGTSIHRLKIRRGGELVLEVLMIDATSFTPPASLVPAGSADAEVTSLEATAATDEFSLRKTLLELNRDTTAEKQIALP
jgi:hypothetical protein